MRSAALFLDRDGVLNRERSFIKCPEELEILPGVRESLSQAQDMGFKLIVVSNQSGIARGLFGFEDLDRIHAKLQKGCGHLLDALYVCPHHPTAGIDALRRTCKCRKPSPGMLLRAQREWDLDLSTSWLIGDAPRDIHAAHEVGVRAICVIGKKMPDPDLWTGDRPETFVEDLAQALEHIKRVA